MRISRRAAIFLMAFGVYSWIIWPTFLKNIWKDNRSWHHGATSFFLVHLVLTVVSLALGTVVAAIGIRAWRTKSAPRSTDQREDTEAAVR